MLRKLFAAMFAATLLAGTALGANVNMTAVVGGGANATKSTSDDGSVGDNILVVTTPGGIIQGESGETADGVGRYFVDGDYNLLVNTGVTLGITGGVGKSGSAGNGGAASLIVGMVESSGAAAPDAKLTVAGTMTLANGVTPSVASSGTGGVAYAGILAGATLTNTGVINVGAGSVMGFQDGAIYASDTGTINLAGTMYLGAAATKATGVVAADNLTATGIKGDAAGTTDGLDKIFKSTNLAADGTIAIALASSANLAAGDLALKSAEGGAVTITTAGASTIAKNIELKGTGATAANLTITAGGVVTMSGSILANTLTTATRSLSGNIISKA